MNLFKTPRVGTANNTAPGGGTAYIALNTDFIARGYREAKGSLEPFSSGRDAARTGATVESAESPFIDIVEGTRDAHVGHANSTQAHALASLDAGLDSLNEAVIKSSIENEIEAARHAAQEQAKPVIERRNDALGNLTEYEIGHAQRPLIPQESYDPYAPVIKQFLLLFLVLGPDALFNALSYASAMPHGLWQALATACCASASMALFGVLFGTGLRYFNYRRGRAQRGLWRTITIGSGILALLVSVGLAQYRSLLEAAVSESGDAVSNTIFNVPPSMVGLPVFIGCVIVFIFASSHFWGGKGSPFARYADHANHDRPFRLAEDEIVLHKEDFALTIDQIAVDHLNALHDAIDREGVLLKEGKAACAAAKLKNRDLRNSFERTIRAAEPDIARVRAGFCSVRTDLDPDDFPPVDLRPSDGFPDEGELDEAIGRAEVAYARRVDQVARLDQWTGTLLTKAREEFSSYVAKTIRSNKSRPSATRSDLINTKGGRS